MTATSPRCSGSSACSASTCRSAMICSACSGSVPWSCSRGTPSTGPAIRPAFPPTPPSRSPSAAPSRTSWMPWKRTSATTARPAAAASSSASCMRERDAELHVVLPFDEDDFCDERLTYGLAGVRVVEATLRRAARIPAGHAALRHDREVPQRPGALRLRGLVHAGAGPDASRSGRRRGHRPGRAGSGDAARPASNLATFVTNWRRTGRELRVIDLAAVRADRAPDDESVSAPIERPPMATPRRTVRAMLFADVAGFSGLPEPHLPAFFIEFLAIVEQQLRVDAGAVPEHLGRRPLCRLRRRRDLCRLRPAPAGTTGAVRLRIVRLQARRGQEAGHPHRPAHGAGVRGLSTRSSAARTISAATSAGRRGSSR